MVKKYKMMKHLKYSKVRVTANDSRTFVGILTSCDRDMNLILENCNEILTFTSCISEPREEERFLGFIFLCAQYVNSISVVRPPPEKHFPSVPPSFYRNDRLRSNSVIEQETSSLISLLSSTQGSQESVRYVENPSPANMVPTRGDILIRPPMLFHSSDMIGPQESVENPSSANMVPTRGDILIGPPILFHSSDTIAGIPKMPDDNGRGFRGRGCDTYNK